MKKPAYTIRPKGSVLIVALFLLLAVALSATYLSIILINEVKSTRAADEGIIADYVTESAAEKALWKLQKSEILNDVNFFVVLNDKKNLCASDDGGTQDRCVSRCSNDTSAICSTPATDCPLGPPTPTCVAAIAGGDAERLYDHKIVTYKAFSFTKYNTPSNTPVYTKIYDPTIRGTSNTTGVKQLNIYWYVDACTSTEQNAVLNVAYQPIDIDTANNDCNASMSGTQYCQTLLTPLGAGYIDITCNCNTGASQGVDEKGITMYRCASQWDTSDSDVASRPAFLNQTQIPDTNYYRLKFTSLTPGVTVRKIYMTASVEGVNRAQYVSNNVYMPSNVEIQSYGTYRGSRDTTDYFTDWKDAYASSTSLFYHEDINSTYIVADNAGRLYTSWDGGVTWLRRYPNGVPGSYNWSVASDYTGQHLMAAQYNGRLYTSADYGVTWTERFPKGNVDAKWNALASDSDGSTLIAAGNDDYVYTSSDYGIHWAAAQGQPASPSGVSWYVASDADGSNLMAATYDPGIVYIYTTATGQWNKSKQTNDLFHAIASDATGTNLYAVTWFTSGGGRSYKSSNGGQTWVVMNDGASPLAAGGIISDATGLKLAYFNGSQLYSSSNGGQSWAPVVLPTNSQSANKIVSVASDSTFQHLIAVRWQPYYWVYISHTSGSSWTTRYPTGSSNDFGTFTSGAVGAGSN